MLAVAAPAHAGPPFVTNDPVPTDPGHWKIYGFVAGVCADGTTGRQSGLGINYASDDLQLTAVVPLGFDTGQGLAGVSNVGACRQAPLPAPGQNERRARGALLPPRVITPTGGTRLGTGHVQLLLPVWVEKDVGIWAVFGGGGPTFDPGWDQRDFWLTGVSITRTLTPRFSLGAEVYRHTRDTREGADFTGVNLGARYKLSDRRSSGREDRGCRTHAARASPASTSRSRRTIEGLRGQPVS